MYETVVYIEVVAVDVYLWCLVVVVPCQDQMTSRARRPASRAKTRLSVYHRDRKLRTCDNPATFVLRHEQLNTSPSLSTPSFQ